MNENIVTLSLDVYDKIRNDYNNLTNKLDQLCSLLINNTELNSSKDDLVFDGYNLKYGRVIDLLKEVNPDMYDKRLASLIKDNS